MIVKTLNAILVLQVFIVTSRDYNGQECSGSAAPLAYQQVEMKFVNHNSMKI